MTPETISTPSSSTPTSDELGNPSRPWFLYFTAITRRLGVLADAVLGWQNMVHQGRIPKVSDVGAIEESSITEDTDKIASTKPLSVTGTVRALSTPAAAPASGKGVEILFDSVADVGYMIAYDRTGAAYKVLDFRGLELLFHAAGVERLQVDASGIDVNGVVKVAGTQVVGAQQADPGVVATPPSISTSNTAQTADGVYSANEQTMLNDLKAGLAAANTTLANQNAQISNLITDRNNLRTVLQAHGLMA